MEWNLTGGRKLLIGMIHCLPLPGTYGATATIDEVIARAVSDAKALERVGFDAVMIENEDLCLEPHMTKVQFSAISMVAQAVRSAVKLPLGLCCSGLNYGGRRRFHPHTDFCRYCHELQRNHDSLQRKNHSLPP